MILQLFVLVAFVLFCISGCSFAEWKLHSRIMHKPLGSFDYPFKAHAGVHHNVYKADYTYHAQDGDDGKLIPMAWWNGLALTFLGSLPFVGLSLLIGNWWITVTAVLVIFFYYCTYEYIHWCMHMPRARNIERTGVFFRLNGHHLLHHRYMHKNFNVVCPLADLVMGTLLIRSPIAFKQASGPSVPDVQPRAEATHVG